MNIHNLSIRPFLLALSAGFMLSAGAAHARPADPNWFGPPKVQPTAPQTCGKVFKPANHGPGTGPKQVWVVEHDLGPCPEDKGRKLIKGYTGPRNTIPVY